MSKSSTTMVAQSSVRRSQRSQPGASEASQGRAFRETLESIAIAVVLAFLFRAFVAEAFVIPTGSMAPTLQGRHMDVFCDQCDYQYRSGASIENDGGGEVVATSCPMCGYTMRLDKVQNPNHRSFSGDRILVSKFAYEIGSPQRWDVLVFKYPGNAKQNYIKRLVGLPEETLRIRHGNIYVRPEEDADLGEGGFRVARKPPRKIQAMLQQIHDTDHLAEELVRAGWPSRWQDWANPESPTWEVDSGGSWFETCGTHEGTAWLRYRHVVARDGDWDDLQRGRIPRTLRDSSPLGELISDYYAYNDGVERSNMPGRPLVPRRSWGLHWVGDLSVEALVQVQGSDGHVLLDLVQGGVHYTCRIDVATGEAELAIDAGRRPFECDRGERVVHPRAPTRVRGPGHYRLQFANVDDQLVLWVNRRLVTFDGPTTYRSEGDVVPRWSPEDAGDLEPAGIGSQGAALSISRLKMYRDVYYISSTHETSETDYAERFGDREILEVFRSPASWEETRIFASRRPHAEFDLGPDAYFPIGDNSPQSRDARLWSHPQHFAAGVGPPPSVRRDLLTGKALLIYWPHPWNHPIPFFPNFRGMGLIR